jgi:hypothetical protein
VIGVVGAYVLLSGFVNASVVAALNSAGVVGVVVLVFGIGAWMSGDDSDRLSRIRNTCWVVGIATVVAGLLFLFGRPMDEKEKQPGLLTVIGVISVLALATLVTLAWREVQKSGGPKKKKCEDCANMVLAEARKCQYCGYRFN